MSWTLKKIPYLCLLFCLCAGAFLCDSIDKVLKYAILFSALASAFVSLKKTDFPEVITAYFNFILPWLPWFFGLLIVLSINQGSHIYLDSYLFLTLIFFGLYKLKINREWVLWATLISCIVLSATAIGYVLTNGLTSYIFEENRNIYVPFTTLLMIVCLSSLLFDSSEYSRLLKLGLVTAVLVCLACIVLTEVRTAILAILAIIPLIFVYRKNQSFKFILVIGAIALFILLLFWYTGRLQQGLADLTKYQAGDSNSSWGIRLELWKLSYDAFLAKPLIGWGEQPFDEILRSGFIFPVESFHPGHSHSDFFNMLVSIGIIGVIGWLLSICLLIKTSWKDPVAVSLLVACLAMGLVERMWFQNRVSIYLISVVWVLLYLSRNSDKIFHCCETKLMN